MSGSIRLLLSAAAITSATSCGGTGTVFEGGEAFGIGATNYGAAPIENKLVRGVEGNNRSYNSQSLSRPYLGQRPSFASTTTLQDNKQKIPEKVSITWQDYPGDGRPSYTGKVNGPFVVEVRSKIPNDVLAYATKRHYSIDIGLAINDGPITMNWALYRVPQIPGEASYLCVGGDYFSSTGQKTFSPLSAHAGTAPVGVWPNCKLP